MAKFVRFLPLSMNTILRNIFMALKNHQKQEKKKLKMRYIPLGKNYWLCSCKEKAANVNLVILLFLIAVIQLQQNQS
jgi:hypothetical protein